MLLTLLQSSIALAAVALGWFLNDRSRNSRENRAAIGRALVTLLFFRRRMAGIKVVVQQLGQWAIPTPSQQHELRVFLDQVMPRLSGWEKEYDNAVNYLAGVNPILAMKLRGAAMRANFKLPGEWPTGPDAPQGFSEIATHFLEPETLDEPIRLLARMHGRKVLRSVNEELEDQDDPDPETSELITRLIPFAGKPGPQPGK